MGVDVRTRRDADIQHVDPAEFFEKDLPEMLRATGSMAARGVAHLGLPAIAIRVGPSTHTLRVADGAVIVEDAANDGLTVEMEPEAFSDWVQDIRTMLALLVVEDARVVQGEANAALGWDAVVRTMVDERPIHQPGDISLVARDGQPLDIERSFGVHADDEEMAWFLEQAGFLMLKGWVDPDLVATISRDIDRGLGSARPDDRYTWWAALEDGTERCVRLKHFCEISETGRLAAESDAFQRICRLTGDPFPLPAPCIEALIKPAGVVAGPSEIRWHKDCWQGRHSFFCSGLTIGILLMPSTEETGCLRVMAGSHRINTPAIDRDIDALDLPVRSLYGEPGDLTVHLSCTMHETIPPEGGERRLMYAGFSLLEPTTGVGVDNAYGIRHADWSTAVSSAWSDYA